MQEQQILRTAAAAAHLGVSVGTLANIRKREATFPKPIALGSRSIGWRTSDLDAWLEARRQK